MVRLGTEISEWQVDVPRGSARELSTLTHDRPNCPALSIEPAATLGSPSTFAAARPVAGHAIH